MKKPLYYLLALSLFVAITPALSQAPIEGLAPERLRNYEAYIQKEIDDGKIPGAVAMIARNGEIVFHEAFGYRNSDEKTEMASDNIFFIQSMTKPIITVAFMMLYEEGHFQLSDPVSNYIPEFADLEVILDPESGKNGETEPLENPITIKHLLSHTAGLSHGLGTTQLDRDYAAVMYRQEHENVQARMLAMLEMPLVGQPGDQWHYSAAPDVLSVLIEKFSGIPTDEFLREKLFIPLGMEDTGYNIPKRKQKNVVPVHDFDNKDHVRVREYQDPRDGVKLWSGVNALYSTTADYLKFCQMLLNGGEYNGTRFLSPKTVELMTLNHTGDLFDRPGEGFGLGFAVVDDLAGTAKLGTEGLYYWGGAYNTHFFIDPGEKLVSLFFTQTANFTWYYHDMMRQMVYQAIVDQIEGK